MKILYLYTLVSSEKIIKNINIPSCRNCVHYKPSYSTTDFTGSFNKCHKFGDKNIITNKISYDYADMCRNNENKCGNEGKYFELEKNVEFKIFMHQIIKNLPNILIISTLVVELLTLLK